MTTEFWKEIPLTDMSTAQWESLCDGCGRCCLHKLEDEETNEVYYTAIACQLLDTSSCQCSDYSHRKQKVPHCIKLTVDDIPHFHWLPDTCAYRLIAEGGELASWHPLVSGSRESIHKAGISVSAFAIPEGEVPEEDWEDHIISISDI